jgi:hypothetical protein
VNMGTSPEAAEPMTSALYRDLVAFFRVNACGKVVDVSHFMMAAAITLLMAGSCRFQDVRRAKFAFVRDYADPQVRARYGGAVSGIDICFPPFVPHAQLGVVRNRRKHNARDLVVRVPEFFACGFPPALVLRDFLQIAPRDGHLFRLSQVFARDRWVADKPDGCLSVSSFHKRLRAAIGKVRPTWDPAFVERFSSHSFRGGAIVSMSAAGVPRTVVSRTVGHRSDTAVQSYLNMSGELHRRALMHAV